MIQWKPRIKKLVFAGNPNRKYRIKMHCFRAWLRLVGQDRGSMCLCAFDHWSNIFTMIFSSDRSSYRDVLLEIQQLFEFSPSPLILSMGLLMTSWGHLFLHLLFLSSLGFLLSERSSGVSPVIFANIIISVLWNCGVGDTQSRKQLSSDRWFWAACNYSPGGPS